MSSIAENRVAVSPPVGYSVTFEYDELPPVTVRGTVSGRHLPANGRMALHLAAQASHPSRWRSVVVVLERPATR